MFKTIIITLSLFLIAMRIDAQSVLDCPGAKHLCSNYDTIPSPYPYSGSGSIANEINTGTPSCYCRDLRAVWYKFTIQQGGVLRFAITPDNSNTDYDWTLFNVSNNVACSTLATYSGAISAMAKSNTWGAYGFNGPTGVSTPNGGTGSCNGPGTGNGPKWDADLSVSVGQTFVLAVQNWSGSTSGYVLDFSASTAVIYDNIPPYMNQFTTNVSCAGASFNTFTFSFSEQIKCNTVSVADFNLIGPNGSHTISSISGSGCSSSNPLSSASTWTVSFTPAISAPGTYVFKLVGGANWVEDMCGNLDTLDSLVFEVAQPIVSTTTTINPLCEGFCTGEMSAIVSSGNAPFEYYWGTSLDSVSSLTGICAGVYPLTITDSLGCEVYDTVTISEPDPYILTLDTILNVSCPASTNCDGGATINVTGNTPPYQYQWTSGEVTQSSFGLCSGTNWVIVTDVNGCQDSIWANILVPDSIVTTAFGDTQICITNAASLVAASTGGTPPFSYIWTRDSLTGQFTSDQVTATVYPHKDRYYFVSSTDSRGCAGDTGLVLVKVRPELSVVLDPTDTICWYDDIVLQAHGIGGDSIYSYTWSTGAFGPTVTVSPDSSKWFVVTVSDYCGTPVYFDSVFVQVGGYPPILANITVEDDSLCPGESVYMIARGRGGFHGPDEYRFSWSNTMESNSYQFVKPLKTSEYVVTISDLCNSPAGFDTVTIYVGQPKYPDLTANPMEACAESDVTFFVDNFQPEYRYDFTMGDGLRELNVQGNKFKHSYKTVGCFDVTVNMVTDFGCTYEQLYPCIIQVLEKPVAAFINNPENPTSLSPFVDFTNTSLNYNYAVWSVDGETFEALNQIKYEFKESSYDYEVQLIVRSEDGCYDTISKSLHYILETVIYYPTSFTPNGDGKNDIFFIEGDALDLNNFDLTIYDRWGHQVFRSNSPFRGWDGDLPDGTHAQLGTYAFTLRYIDRYKNEKVVNNSVTISKAGEHTGLK